MSLFVGLLLAFAASSAVAAPAILSVDQIRPGQKGYGLTVFHDFKVERFKVEVIDVMKNFLPKQDIILMRGDHPVLRRAGVLGGMSGSPIYLQGKLVGALAYGWRFSKEPIFGVTPIGSMLPLIKKKTRGRKRSGAMVASAPALLGGEHRARLARLLRRISDRNDPWRMLGWPRRKKRAISAQSALAPVSVPLSVAGMSPKMLPDLKQAFSRYGFEPLQGGGTGKAAGPRKFVTGGALGVRLVSGDISMTGTGTVTYKANNRVLAFGHSMFNAGEIYLPVVSAQIIHPLASVSRSFKLSRPARELGMLVQDRQPGIMAHTDKRIKMLPMTITIRNREETKVYTLRLAKHRFLTPSLIRSVVASAIKEAMADVAAATYKMQTIVAVKGQRTITIKDEAYSRGGLRLGMYFAKGVRALRTLIGNPIAPVDIDRVDIKIDVRFGERPLKLVGLRVASNIVRAGETLQVEARFRAFGGKETTRSFPVQIPKSMAGGIALIELAGGRYARPVAAAPETLPQVLDYLEKKLGYPGRSLVLSVHLPTQGLAMQGRVLSDLPQSVIDALRTGTAVSNQTILRTKVRRVFPTQQFIAGRQRLRLRVTNEVKK